MANKIISYANEDAIYTKARADAPEHDPDREQIREALKARLLGQDTTGVDGGGYAQVDLRPSWYKRFLAKNNYDISGPPTTGVGADIAGAVGEAAVAGAQNNVNQLARMPGARADQVARLQAKANSRGMLSGALGALLSKKSNDFDTQQKRAALDASTLNKRVKSGASNNELLGYLNYDKTQVRNDELAQQKAIEEARRIAEADKNSPESRRTQVAAVGSGVVSPEMANDLPKKELETWRPAFQQTQAQENKTNEFDYETSVQEGRKLSEEERTELRRVEEERRRMEQDRRQNFIPGHKWANNTPPSPDVAKQAREFTASQQRLIKSAEELKDIQNRLAVAGAEAQRAGVTSPAAIGQYFDKYFGTEEVQNMLARAQLLQKDMVTAMRAKDHLGVLQQFEKAMEEAVNPMAGTLSAFFRGPSPWDAIIDTERRYGRDYKKQNFQLYEDDDPEWSAESDPLNKPAEDSVRRFERPTAPRPHTQTQRPRGSVQAPLGQSAPTTDGEDYGVQPGDSLGGTAPVPPMPAGARQPGAPAPVAGPQGDKPMAGMWVVEVNGKRSKPRPLTESQYKMLQQKYGLGAVKKAQ